MPPEDANDLTLPQKIARGVTAWDRDDYEAALDDFRAVLDARADFPDVHNKAGLCLAMMGDFAASLEHFDEAVRLSPTYAEAHLNRAIVLNSMGRFDDAGDAFGRAGELDRRNSGRILSDVGNQIAVQHARLGDLYMKAEAYDEAARQYEKGLDVRPTFVDIRAKLAEALMLTEEWERARQELEQILDETPRFTGARLRLGVIHRREGRVDEALVEWERCMEEEPRDLRARAYIAEATDAQAPAGSSGGGEADSGAAGVLDGWRGNGGE